MILGADSSFDRPTLDQARAAFAAGFRAWGGYLVTADDAAVIAARGSGQPGMFGLAAPWTRAEFQVVQDAGMRAIAFSSGQDDPAALGAKAAAWDLLGLLDDEDAIRPEGSWVDPWLQASGFGLYGLMAVQRAHAAPYRIVALYPAGGCQGATWPTSPPPAEPHGWQCQGTHVDPVTGLEIDLSNLDDFFGPVPAPPPPTPVKEDDLMTGPSVIVGPYNDQLHQFQVTTGGIRHRWLIGVTWQGPETLPGSENGLEAGQPVSASVTLVPGQLQVWAERANQGDTFHAWHDGAWHSEII